MTVALAIPLAAMRYDDLPLKAILGILFFASLSAVALPMGLAYALHMSSADIMAFATRAVTTPIAINIATLLEAPIQLAVLIVILSGVVGAAFSPLILRHINDERASEFGTWLSCTCHWYCSSMATWQCCRTLCCLWHGSQCSLYRSLAANIYTVFTKNVTEQSLLKIVTISLSFYYEISSLRNERTIEHGRDVNSPLP